MAVVIITAGLIVTLSLVLFTVNRLRPQKFKIKATLAKWASLDLEMESPEWTRQVKDTVQPRARTAATLGTAPRARRSVTPPANGQTSAKQAK